MPEVGKYLAFPSALYPWFLTMLVELFVTFIVIFFLVCVRLCVHLANPEVRSSADREENRTARWF